MRWGGGSCGKAIAAAAAAAAGNVEVWLNKVKEII